MLAAASLAGCGQLLDLDWRPAEQPGDAAGSGGAGGGIRVPTPSDGASGLGGAGGAGPTSTTSTSVSTSGSTTSSTSTSTSASAGAGGGSQCSSGADCPGVDTNCRVRDCIAGSCAFTNMPPGQSCNAGDGYCDGLGNCIECAVDSHCDNDEWCEQGLCVGCNDNDKNGAETDVDCGGPVCKGCDEGEQCNVNSDCKKGVCAAGICNKHGFSQSRPEVP